MHKLLNYLCDELEELEKKAGGDGLSKQEIEYGDILAHFKKNLLTGEAMMEYDDSDYYSGSRRRDRMGRYSRGYDDGHGYYGRNYAPRSYGRYSRDKDELVAELRELEMSMTDEETKRMLHKFIKQAEENV